MKSLQVKWLVANGQTPKSEAQYYSELQVLKSNTGFYVGTIYTDPSTGITEPGTRDSDYFSAERRARAELDKFISGDLTWYRYLP